MTTVKVLAIAALLVGGTSLALAQNGQPTGGYPPVMGGAGGNPAVPAAAPPQPPGPGVIPHDTRQSAARPATGTSAGTRIAHTTKHHKNMYMSAKGSRHKTLKTGQQLPK